MAELQVGLMAMLEVGLVDRVARGGISGSRG